MSPTLSLSDPPGSSAIAGGISWVEGAALGSIATMVAVIAVAAIGLLMLSGRLDLRRGIAVVLGCFLLFGATDIATALAGLASSDRVTIEPSATTQSAQFSNHLSSLAPHPAAYDPYAGASVPARRPR